MQAYSRALDSFASAVVASYALSLSEASSAAIHRMIALQSWSSGSSSSVICKSGEENLTQPYLGIETTIPNADIGNPGIAD